MDSDSETPVDWEPDLLHHSGKKEKYNFRGESIFITGGTGFFGRALLRNLKNLEKINFKVTVLSRSPKIFLDKYPEFDHHKWLNFIKGDILNPESFPQRLKFTHIIHAATDSTNGPLLSPIQRYNQIVEGTKNILEFAKINHVKHFLLTSSGGVYGPQPENMERIPETYCGMFDPLIPSNTYNVSKRTAEHLCSLYQDAYGIEVIIARCFSFVGEDLPLNVHYAIGNFILNALTGKDIVINGDGLALRSYLDQRDLAVWLLTILKKGSPGRAYNVGSEEPISIGALAELVRDIISPKSKIHILNNLSNRFIKNRYIPDTSRARSEFDLSPPISLSEAIRFTALSIQRKISFIC